MKFQIDQYMLGCAKIEKITSPFQYPIDFVLPPVCGMLPCLNHKQICTT